MYIVLQSTLFFALIPNMFWNSIHLLFEIVILYVSIVRCTFVLFDQFVCIVQSICLYDIYISTHVKYSTDCQNFTTTCMYHMLRSRLTVHYCFKYIHDLFFMSHVINTNGT